MTSDGRVEIWEVMVGVNWGKKQGGGRRDCEFGGPEPSKLSGIVDGIVNAANAVPPNTGRS